MREAPKLLDLCMTAIRDELLQGDDENNDIASVIPSGLLHSLLPHLPSLALQKLHDNLPDDLSEDFAPASDSTKDGRKRRRCGILDAAWRALYEVRWPSNNQRNQADVWLKKHGEEKRDHVVDWQQMYWEAHFQDCVDAVAETALLPSYDGSIGEIQIPDAILEIIGCRSHVCRLTSNYLKFSHHCHQFGVYARSLRLPNALCVAESCHLLQSSKLVSLELQWIKSRDHVEGLCELLRQNIGTLKRIEFMHCKFSPTFINVICDSLYLDGLQTHGIEEFSIKRSSFLQSYSSPIPVKLESFLRSGRSLRALKFSDDQLGRNFARAIFHALNASDGISILDLSENDISGFLLQFRLISVMGSETWSLKSLRALNLRSCNLVDDDLHCLREALIYMPNLEKLDLSDNFVEDGLRYLVTYFTEISSRDLPFVDLKLENCELTSQCVNQLLEVLSTLKMPLGLLSIKGNRLGSKIGTALGKFICSGVRTLDIEDIGFGAYGFKEALGGMAREIKLGYINMSNNQGGIEAAKFVAKLISDSQEIVAIDSRYNLMPAESLSMIHDALKASKGKLEHLDLEGNNYFYELANALGILFEFQKDGQFIVNFPLSAAPDALYDNDP